MSERLASPLPAVGSELRFAIRYPSPPQQPNLPIHSFPWQALSRRLPQPMTDRPSARGLGPTGEPCIPLRAAACPIGSRLRCSQWCPIGMAWPPAWLARSTVGHGFGRAFAIPDRSWTTWCRPPSTDRSIDPMGWACGATAWPSARARTALSSTGTAAALVTCAWAGLQDKKNGLAGSIWSTEEARCRPQPIASSRPTSVLEPAAHAAFMNHAACSARPALNLRRDASQPRASPRRVCHDAVRHMQAATTTLKSAEQNRRRARERPEIESRCGRCQRGEPIPDADVAGVSSLKQQKRRRARESPPPTRSRVFSCPPVPVPVESRNASLPDTLSQPGSDRRAKLHGSDP